MKTELKISTLSIICVLGTVIALPSFGASAVRSLGGAGTYSSASSAATAGAKPTTGTVGSVRAGSLRTTAAKSTASSKVSSTRTAAAPRLSIGKYLGGVALPGGAGSSSGTINPGQSSISDLKKTVDDLVVDVEGLKEEIASLTGEYPTVEFENGILTIVQDGVPEEIDLNDYFASEESLSDLEDRINEIVIPDLSEYAKKSDLDGLLTSADLSELQSAVDALESADVSMNAAIEALQGGMITADDLNAKVEELKAVDAGLQAAINELKNSTPSTEGLVNKEYVDAIKSNLEAADVALQNAIAAIEQPDVNKAYVDAAIAGLNEAIVALQGADSAMGQAITDLQARLEAVENAIEGFVTSSDVENQIDVAIEGLATKQELADAKSELQDAIDRINAGQAELTNYYTKAEADAKFATKDMIKDYTAGENVSISEGGVISATDTTYTAGDNVTIENGVISATDTDTTYTAGDNIAIENGVISATDTTYSAGDNVTIENGVISATDTDTTYTAGENIKIENNVISATDTTYTAGDNIAIENGEISATYSAGDNVTIENGVISATDTDTTYTAGENIKIENNVISATGTTYEAGENITIEGGVISATGTTYDLGNAQTAGVTKLYGTTGESEDGAMTQKAVTDELNAISETLENFDLDGVLRSAATQGSYVVNFDNAGNVSYAPIEIIGGDFKPLDLTLDAVVPSTTMSLN
ncbi:MAG: hypothetical protein E7007_00450 [Alphaproteobacteria bacterium]|nr:hypothetical protein [Alphaproteobacteria bacterium]